MAGMSPVIDPVMLPNPEIDEGKGHDSSGSQIRCSVGESTPSTGMAFRPLPPARSSSYTH